MKKDFKKRMALIEAANRLFERQGFNGTGVEQIAAEAGVTKRTLYLHFGSKDGLIEEVLKWHQEAMMARTRDEISSMKASATDRILACFDLYRKWFSQPDFAGCIFVKTVNELSACSAQLCGLAIGAKIEMREFIRELAAEGSAKDPDRLADELQLLLEGSIVVAQCGRGEQGIRAAKNVAGRLIRDAVT